MVIGMKSTWRILSIWGSPIIVAVVVMFVGAIVVVWTGPIRDWMLEGRLDWRWSLSVISCRLAIKTHTYWRAHQDRLIMLIWGSVL